MDLPPPAFVRFSAFQFVFLITVITEFVSWMLVFREPEILRQAPEYWKNECWSTLMSSVMKDHENATKLIQITDNC